MAGLGISVVTFAISRTFAALVLTRCIGGALGGAWGYVHHQNKFKKKSYTPFNCFYFIFFFCSWGGGIDVTFETTPKDLGFGRFSQGKRRKNHSHSILYVSSVAHFIGRNALYPRRS